MTTDELRAKFETWWTSPRGFSMAIPQEVESHFRAYQAAHASRDAEVEALRKDAERYRWLRSRVAGTDRKPFICIFHGNFSLWNGEHADCEIDTAMRDDKE